MRRSGTGAQIEQNVVDQLVCDTVEIGRGLVAHEHLPPQYKCGPTDQQGMLGTIGARHHWQPATLTVPVRHGEG